MLSIELKLYLYQEYFLTTQSRHSTIDFKSYITRLRLEKSLLSVWIMQLTCAITQVQHKNNTLWKQTRKDLLVQFWAVFCFLLCSNTWVTLNDHSHIRTVARKNLEGNNSIYWGMFQKHQHLGTKLGWDIFTAWCSFFPQALFSMHSES